MLGGNPVIIPQAYLSYTPVALKLVITALTYCVFLPRATLRLPKVPQL